MNLWTQGEADGGTNCEIRTDIYTLLCVKQIASRKLLSSTGCSAQWSVIILEGLDGGAGVGGRLKKQRIYVYI